METLVQKNAAKAATVVPRFEFRSFGQDFSNPARRMARLSMPVPENLWERNSDEIYIVSRISDLHNIKLRNGNIEAKSLLRTTDHLEQWLPVMESGFPMDSHAWQEQLLPLLQIQQPWNENKSVSLDIFLSLIDESPHLQRVSVRKQRFAYQVNDCICETAVVLVNGARMMTISCESASSETLHETLRMIGLEELENINYLEAIKRVIGMNHKPLAN